MRRSRKLGLDTRTALVLLTHDPKLDDPALQAGSASGCVLHRRAGQQENPRRPRRPDAGGRDSPKTRSARIHGPIGLDIGAAGPAEIAVSILSEMTAVLRGKQP